MTAHLIIRNCTVWTGTGRVLPGQDVTVTAGHIERIEEADGSPAAEHTEQVDFAGGWLLPGLTDLHSHLTLDRSAPEQNTLNLPSVFAAAQAAQETLAAGVTRCRDVGGHQHVDVALRNAIENGQVPGPRLQVAGKPIVATGGHIWYFGREADGPAEVTKAVREQVKAGADLIKVMLTGGSANVGERPDRMQLNSDELAAAADTAAEAGLPLAVHAHSGAAVRAAAEAGATTVEHGALLDDDGIEALLETGCALVPTQAVYRRLGDNVDGWDPRKAAAAAALFDTKQETLAKAIAAGVRIGVGTDSGRHFPHGQAVAEMVELVEAGMSTEDVLLAATRGNAELIGAPESAAGIVAEGQVADLVGVHGDPREDLRRLTRPALVVARGNLVRHMGG